MLNAHTGTMNGPTPERDYAEAQTREAEHTIHAERVERFGITLSADPLSELKRAFAAAYGRVDELTYWHRHLIHTKARFRDECGGVPGVLTALEQAIAAVAGELPAENDKADKLGEELRIALGGLNAR